MTVVVKEIWCRLVAELMCRVPLVAPVIQGNQFNELQAVEYQRGGTRSCPKSIAQESSVPFSFWWC